MDKVLSNNNVRKAYAFRRGPIALSLNTSTQALFSSGQISLHIDDIFWNYLRHERESNRTKSTIGKIIEFLALKYEGLKKNAPVSPDKSDDATNNKNKWCNMSSCFFKFDDGFMEKKNIGGRSQNAYDKFLLFAFRYDTLSI
jgi:hypothetical protein